MKDNKVYSKEDIKKYTSNIDRLKMKNHTVEKFRQISVDTVYTPYLISSYGRIVSIHYSGKKESPHLLRTKIQNNGYVSVQISVNDKSKTMLVHRLVANAFIKNLLCKPEVNHLDCIKTHNYEWNLEWATRKENDEHAVKNGLRVFRYGEDIGNNNYTETQVNAVCVLLVENKLQIKEISKVTGVSYDMVRNILNHKSWKHVSKDYDFSDYRYGSSEDEINNKLQKIHEVCKLLESNKYTLTQISNITSIKIGIIYKILTKKCYIDISKKYHIENYKTKRGKK